MYTAQTYTAIFKGSQGLLRGELVADGVRWSRSEGFLVLREWGTAGAAGQGPPVTSEPMVRRPGIPDGIVLPRSGWHFPFWTLLPTRGEATMEERTGVAATSTPEAFHC